MHIRMNRRVALLMATGLSTALPGLPAFAQEAPPAAVAAPAASQDPATEQATGIEDIVVTAERRESSVQRTAAALTTVSGEDLSTRGVTDMVAAGTLAPSVHVNNYATGVQIVVRGVYAQSASPSADPAIAFNLDGVYLARPAAAAGAFYDVSRIEVLRGPQGTLYGRNATGGSFNLITNRPTANREGSVDVGVGNYGLWSATGVFNTPITDNLYFRAAVNALQHDGYTDNAPVADGNDEDTLSGRAQLLWLPSDTVDVRLVADFTTKGGVGPAGRLLTNRDDSFAFPLNTASELKNDSWGVMAEANWDLGPATLTYVGAYRELDYAYRYDNDYSLAQDQITYITQQQHQITNEVRIASNGDGPLQYVAGLYQFFESSPYEQKQVQTPSPGYTITMDAPVIEATAYAAYGQATYSVTDRFRLTGGLRFTYDKKSQEARYLLNGSPITDNSGEKSWDAVNYKVAAEYDLTPQNMLYANISTAYKAGGINQSIPATTYEPEELLAYVVGSKNRFFDNNLQLNAEAFYYDYSDYHGSLSLTAPTAGGPHRFNTIANARKAEIYGLEVEGVVRLGDYSRLDGYVSVLRTEFLDYAIGTTNLTGNELAKAPELSFNIGYEQTIPVGAAGTLVARAELHREGDQFMSPTNAVTAFQEAYEEANANVRFEPANGRWYANAWVRNIGDDVHLTHVSLGAFINNPRTFGLTVGARF